MFYYTFTTFDCNFIPRNAEICKVSSETKNVGKAHKYRLNRHLPTYEKIIKNLYSFYANKNYFLYHENPNLIKADGYYLYNFGSPRHYYWALPVKFTHEDKVYHSQLPLDIRDESSSCTVDLRIYIPADSSGSAFTFRNNITIPALWRIFIFVPLLLLLTSKRKA